MMENRNDARSWESGEPTLETKLESIYEKSKQKSHAEKKPEKRDIFISKTY